MHFSSFRLVLDRVSISFKLNPKMCIFNRKCVGLLQCVDFDDEFEKYPGGIPSNLQLGRATLPGLLPRSGPSVPPLSNRPPTSNPGYALGHLSHAS